VGKSMLALRLTIILPAMTLAEAIETTRIHRVAGRTGVHPVLTVANLGRVPPYDLVAAAGHVGGRLVKHVTQLSRQQACSLVPVPGQVSVIFHKSRRELALLAGEVTEGMAGPGRTAPAAAIFRMECPAEAELDTSVLQMWRQLFYPRGDESI
jgi:Magnesium chelatase, subunit ChlI